MDDKYDFTGINVAFYITTVTVYLPGTLSEVYRGNCVCMETFYMYICSHFQSYIRKIYSSESEYTKVRIKRKELNDMWPQQLDDNIKV